MATRLELHERLCEVFTQSGKWYWDPFNFETDDIASAVRREAGRHVYYQPPETFKMVYPCIIYELERDQVLHADDSVYNRKKRYSVKIVDKNPDSDLPDQFGNLFNVGMERHFTADNLHHFVFSITY